MYITANRRSDDKNRKVDLSIMSGCRCTGKLKKVYKSKWKKIVNLITNPITLSERVGDYSVMPDDEFFHLDHGENKSHLNDNNL